MVTRGTDVTINAFFKHSRMKQYLKDGRALRIETVINAPGDLRCQRRLHNLGDLQAKARDVNTRLLDTERVGQGCVLASPAFERVALSSVTAEGRRAPALRFGDPRVMARSRPAGRAQRPSDSSHRSPRPGEPPSAPAYTATHDSYDLARRLNGLIERLEHTDTYVPDPEGSASRSSTPSSTTGCCDRYRRQRAPAPPELRGALATIDCHIRGYIDHARLGNAA